MQNIQEKIAATAIFADNILALYQEYAQLKREWEVLTAMIAKDVVHRGAPISLFADNCEVFRVMAERGEIEIVYTNDSIDVFRISGSSAEPLRQRSEEGDG